MNISIRPHEIAGLLDRAEGIACLSLDCFDTLLWRGTNKPGDLFATFDLPGGGVEQRAAAEAAARRHAQFNDGRNEVSIEEIYDRLLPAGDADARAAAIARELAAEAAHCFAFQPVVDLIAAAKARDLQVIIVSDTYLSERQLSDLIVGAAGQEVRDGIDRIFCSSQFGEAKGEGLFAHVLAETGHAADAILHVGDNKQADQVAPAALGLRTAHIVQFDAATEQRLRMEAGTAILIDPAVRVRVPAYQPHRARIAMQVHADEPSRLGHDVMGPVMHGFADWIAEEAAALAEAHGAPVKPLFLLRDGHLPARMFAALHPELPAASVEISRFTAFAASFNGAEAIHSYLAGEAAANRPETLARQLMLDPGDIQKIVRAKSRAAGLAALRAHVAVPSNRRRICQRSDRFADRLVAHLKQAGVAPGDTVMLVDLGYNGSVQNRIAGILAAKMGLHVAGRYLLLREKEASGLDKKGFVDTRHHDWKTVSALCGSISILEQLCTLEQGSVVDYRTDGTPIRKAADIKARQSATRETIQRACVEYGIAAAAPGQRRCAADTTEARRQMATACLARLLYLPSEAEIALFESFEHDVNLGTDATLRMIDDGAARDGLRRRGMTYLNDADRMFLPGELRRHGLPLNLSLLSVARFGLDLRAADFLGGAIRLPVVLADATSQTIVEIEAHPTFDGYYAASIAVGQGRLSAGILPGALFEWMQIADARYEPVSQLGQRGADKVDHSRPAPLIYENIESPAEGLHRLGPDALILAPAQPGAFDEDQVLSLVFRPVTWRADAAAVRQAA